MKSKKLKALALFTLISLFIVGCGNKNVVSTRIDNKVDSAINVEKETEVTTEDTYNTEIESSESSGIEQENVENMENMENMENVASTEEAETIQVDATKVFDSSIIEELNIIDVDNKLIDTELSRQGYKHNMYAKPITESLSEYKVTDEYIFEYNYAENEDDEISKFKVVYLKENDLVTSINVEYACATDKAKEVMKNSIKELMTNTFNEEVSELITSMDSCEIKFDNKIKFNVANSGKVCDIKVVYSGIESEVYEYEDLYTYEMLIDKDMVGKIMSAFNEKEVSAELVNLHVEDDRNTFAEFIDSMSESKINVIVTNNYMDINLVDSIDSIEGIDKVVNILEGSSVEITGDISGADTSTELYDYSLTNEDGKTDIHIEKN